MTEKYTLPSFNYKGSKQRLLPFILRAFPKNYENLHYVEPFGGSAIVLLNKKKSYIESFNDIDDNVFNFFNVVKTQSKELIKKIESNLPSESEYKRCIEKLKDKSIDKMERAYCFYMSQNMGISGQGGHWGYIIKEARKSGYIQKLRTLHLLANRVKFVQLFNRSAEEIIKKTDSKIALFYLDPPYPESSQFYKFKYTIKDFNRLLLLLKQIQGKFILSCYKKEWMELASEWKTVYKKVNYSHVQGGGAVREECMIKNF